MRLGNKRKCPVCHTSWDAGRIWKVWREQPEYAKYTIKELKRMEKESYNRPYHFSRLQLLSDKYTDEMTWECPECKTKWDYYNGEQKKWMI